MEGNPMERKIRAIIEPRLADAGFELLLVEFRAGSGRASLRVFIDLPEGGIGMQHIEEASRTISALLDVEDPITSQYSLEVSSPGLNRPLVKEKDFKRFIGEKVKIKTNVSVAGRRNFYGRLVSFEEDGAIIRVETEEGTAEIQINQIARANLEYDFEKKSQ